MSYYTPTQYPTPSAWYSTRYPTPSAWGSWPTRSPVSGSSLSSDNIIKSTAITTGAASGVVIGLFIFLAIVLSLIANNSKRVLARSSFRWSEVNCCGGANDDAAPEEIDPQNIYLRHILRPAGLLMLLLGICEFGIGLSVYTFWKTFPKVGAFWAAVLAVPTGASAMWAKSRSSIIAVCVLASFSIVVGVAAAATDGIASAIWTSPAICGQVTKDPPGAFLYGDTDNKDLIKALSSWMFIYLLGSPLSLSDPTFCYCIAGKSSIGSAYNLASAKNTCADVRNSWMNNLSASAAMCSLICILSFILAVVSCVDLCRKPKEIVVFQTGLQTGNPAMQMAPAKRLSHSSPQMQYPQQYPQAQLQYPQMQQQQYPQQMQQQYPQQMQQQMQYPQQQFNVPAYDQTYAGGQDQVIGRGSDVELAAFRSSGGGGARPVSAGRSSGY